MQLKGFYFFSLDMNENYTRIFIFRLPDYFAFYLSDIRINREDNRIDAFSWYDETNTDDCLDYFELPTQLKKQRRSKSSIIYWSFRILNNKWIRWCCNFVICLLISMIRTLKMQCRQRKKRVCIYHNAIGVTIHIVIASIRIC